MQRQCKASSNEIQSLPDTISIFWRTHLQEVDFSENSLTELPSYIFELEVKHHLLDLLSHLCVTVVQTLYANKRRKNKHIHWKISCVIRKVTSRWCCLTMLHKGPACSLKLLLETFQDRNSLCCTGRGCNAAISLCVDHFWSFILHIFTQKHIFFRLDWFQSEWPFSRSFLGGSVSFCCSSFLKIYLKPTKTYQTTK